MKSVNKPKGEIVQRLGISLLLLLLAGCGDEKYMGRSDTTKFAFSSVVQHSKGGDILRTLQVLDMAAESRHRQIIDGACNSACTLVLAYEHVCWTERSQFGFHGANQLIGTVIMYMQFPDELIAELPPPDEMSPSRWIRIDGKRMSEILGRDTCTRG